MPSSDPFDYVIVGAGSAGCVLANRLTEDPGVRVLVLEAGGWDRDPWIRIPLGWGRILEERRHDWGYFAEPEANVNGRRVEFARGKVIGGSSSINAMAYTRGHRADYDRWAACGLEGWSYAHVLPYFRRQESWEGGASLYRGGDGPLTTRMSRYADPLVDAYIQAGAAAGHPLSDDYNGARQEGFSRMQSTIRNGLRCSAADAYLRPAMRRANLRIETHALATRVVFEGDRAVGVEYAKSGRRTIAHAGREVILAGGVINTPQLLMLSGIGDPDELAAHGLTARAPLRGVGKNLQDHVMAAVAYRRKAPGPFQRNLRLDRVALALGKAYLFGTGFATDLPSGLMGFLKALPDAKVPDVQVLFHAGPRDARPYLPPFRRAFADGFAAVAAVLRPESRGHLRLASANPATPIRIHQNFLAADRDWQTLRAGIRLVREIAKQRPLAPFVASEMAPGPGQDADADLDAHIRATAITVHHPLGTCKMGLASDALAVVDPELRVFGVSALRVVDASVMPDLVGGNINAAVIMIAEKTADLIRGRSPLVPVAVDAPQGTRRACRLPIDNQEPRRQYSTPFPRRSGVSMTEHEIMGSKPAATATSLDRAAALESLHEEIAQRNMYPFWAVTAGPQHDEVRRLMGETRRAAPFLWSYATEIEPLLQKAAKLVTTIESERRSLILVNPALAPRRATVTTMYTAYRLNDANEVMPPHRHSPSAIRFGLTGTQNFTGVEGEDVTFGPGDLVLTPHDTWHNHGNVGDAPAVNLSVLDLPLVETLNAVYFEHDYKEIVDGEAVAKKVQSARFPSDYSARIYGQGGFLPRFVSHHRGTGEASPMYCYRWAPVREMLEHHKSWDGDPYEALMIEYVDPTNGRPVFRTMTFFAQMLRPGERTRPLKQSASLLVTPFEGGGLGHSFVGGKRFDWKNFDTLAVPGGEWCEHVNESQSPIVLFVASDEPALAALGLHKKWGRTPAGDVVRLV